MNAPLEPLELRVHEIAASGGYHVVFNANLEFTARVGVVEVLSVELDPQGERDPAAVRGVVEQIRLGVLEALEAEDLGAVLRLTGLWLHPLDSPERWFRSAARNRVAAALRQRLPEAFHDPVARTVVLRVHVVRQTGGEYVVVFKAHLELTDAPGVIEVVRVGLATGSATHADLLEVATRQIRRGVGDVLEPRGLGARLVIRGLLLHVTDFREEMFRVHTKRLLERALGSPEEPAG